MTTGSPSACDRVTMGGMELLDYLGYALLAVGAALGVGTGLALLTYRRTGAFPGQPEDGIDARPAVTSAVAKVVVGVVLLLGGLALLAA